MKKIILFFTSALLLTLLSTACTTPQERSGVNPKPFNAPARWETNPYEGRFQN